MVIAQTTELFRVLAQTEENFLLYNNLLQRAIVFYVHHKSTNSVYAHANIMKTK